MKEDLTIRRATIDDIEFLTDTIVAAEKSGTDNFGLAKLFELALPIAEKILPLITDHVFPLVISTSFVGHVRTPIRFVVIMKRILITTISELTLHIGGAVGSVI